MLENWLIRPIFTFLLKLFFRVEIRGIEHFHAAGKRVLVVANHVSFLDPLLLGVFLPEKPAFAVNIYHVDKWYVKCLSGIIRLYSLDPSKPLSMKRLIQDLRKDARVVIFPEGRISTSGGIMKMYDGAGLIVEKTGATILPVRIEGAEYSKVSRLSARLRQRWFPKVRITYLPPVRFAEGEIVSPHAMYDIMTQAAFEARDYKRPLLDAVLDAYAWHGGSHVVACDIARQDMNYRSLFTRGFILSNKLSNTLHDQRYVAIMLPSAVGAIVSFIAMHMLGKVPCMLNFSSGESNILHACSIANVKTVLTSRAFIEKAKLEHIVTALEKNYRVVYLEDIRPTLTLADKLMGALNARFVRNALLGVIARTDPNEPAVILYTSGSEGVPKGVALSHSNLLSNIYQASARLDLTTSDQLFNAMPVFHSFGLTVGMILPLVRGIKTFMYPSPLHYRVIPELVYDSDATIMLGTDTFYRGYANYAHPYDFWRIRLAVAGAEKLKDSTSRLYAERFGVTIRQGYGVTEASPVVSVNTPLENKPGSVGRALPDIECRTEAVPGLDTGGRLFIKGPNIMLGYLKADKPGVIQPQDEWYDTGDIVDIDAEGYITIMGRAKRFAKIAGEMVSLQAVEEVAAGLLPDIGHAAIAIPDERKGEQVVLYTETKDMTRDNYAQHARSLGVADICLPRHILYIDAIPRLGNGKIDYITLAKLHITAV